MYACIFNFNIVGWCIDKGYCECSMPQCYGSNRKPCEDRMCNNLYEIIFNEHDCWSGPKYKYTTVILHCIGFLLGLGNFYSGRFYIGLIQLILGLITMISDLLKYDKKCHNCLRGIAVLWCIIEIVITCCDFKEDGNGCPLYIGM